MQKPPVDIEWYEDGFTMEEQAELRKEYKKRQSVLRPKISVTEKQKEDWKDALIRELKMKLAANEEYIQELEDQEKGSKEFQEMKKELSDLRNKNQSMKTQLSAYNIRYQNDIKEHFASKYQDKLDEIKELKAANKQLRQEKDDLIYRLIQATDGKRID